MNLNVMIQKYLAGELEGNELRKAETVISKSPALKAIVTVERRKAAGIVEEPLPGLDPYLIIKYVVDFVTEDERKEVEKAIQEDDGQTQDEIDMLRQLIAEGELDAEGMRRDFAKYADRT